MSIQALMVPRIRLTTDVSACCEVVPLRGRHDAGVAALLSDVVSRGRSAGM